MFQKYLPVLRWLPAYSRYDFKGDLVAGITVGFLLVPQGMAYAMIAGLPPVYGLYAALIPQLVYALMGTSRQLSVGPVAMDSLLVASGLGALALSGLDEYISMAIFLALFMGTLQLGLGFLRMGFLVNFLSRPVINGFTSAAAVIIGLGQIKYLFGVDVAGSNQVHILFSELSGRLGDIHWPTLAIGFTSILFLKVLKKLGPGFPAALIVVVLAITGAYSFGVEVNGVHVVGSVPGGLPSFQIPELSWSRIRELFPVALTLALVAFMEAISVAKAIEERRNSQELDPNQELIALGAANVFGAFFLSYPTTGGFSRTAVNDQAGARTGIAALISAALVGLTLLFLTPMFYHLPLAVLAAIIVVAVSGLIDLSYPIELLRDRPDEFILLLLTFLLTLTVGISQGILFGVLISLLLLVYRISKPHIAVLGRIRGTQYFRNVERFGTDTEVFEHIVLLRFDGQLFFGNQEYFRKSVLRHVDAKGPTLEYVILNAEAINYADSSAVQALGRLTEELHARGIYLILAGAIGPLRDILFSSGLADKLGRENLFENTYEAFHYVTAGKAKSEAGARIANQSKKSSYVT